MTFAYAERRLEEGNPAVTSPHRTLQWARTPDGRALSFAEYGDLVGRPVLFMHGEPGCRLLSTTQRRLGYDELMAELGVRLIRHDRPGFGPSDRHRGRRMTDTAADVATIADVLAIGQFAAVGGSGGTGHALATAAALPERASRVAVTAPAAPYAVVGHDAFTAGMNERVQAYFEAIRNGEDAMTADFGAEDAELRAGASADEPDQRGSSRRRARGWVADVDLVRPQRHHPPASARRVARHAHPGRGAGRDPCTGTRQPGRSPCGLGSSLLVAHCLSSTIGLSVFGPRDYAARLARAGFRPCASDCNEDQILAPTGVERAIPDRRSSVGRGRHGVA